MAEAVQSNSEVTRDVREQAGSSSGRVIVYPRLHNDVYIDEIPLPLPTAPFRGNVFTVTIGGTLNQIAVRNMCNDKINEVVMVLFKCRKCMAVMGEFRMVIRHMLMEMDCKAEWEKRLNTGDAIFMMTVHYEMINIGQNWYLGKGLRHPLMFPETIPELCGPDARDYYVHMKQKWQVTSVQGPFVIEGETPIAQSRGGSRTMEPWHF